MTSQANTLGRFVADLMAKHGLSNRTLAAIADISESAVRNLLKVGVEPNAKDPDARTLSQVAKALDVNALRLFRLAGYIPPAPDANSVRAEYLADVFDNLPPEKQDAVMSVLEAMSEPPREKSTIREMRRSSHDALAGMDLNFPAMIRDAANQLIVQYAITSPADVDRIEPDTVVAGNKWLDLSIATRKRITALIRHKLSLDYDPTMVDPEWRA